MRLLYHQDTFYDPEDGNELKLKLLTTERQTLDPYHWLQFDSKNQEFYGVPRPSDIGRKEYLLVSTKSMAMEHGHSPGTY